MIFFKEDYKTIYKGLFTPCSYSKTKKSYDRWITRRVWGFRHQISKAKYLKKAVGNIRKLQENTAALCNILPSTWSDPGKRHGGSGHG